MIPIKCSNHDEDIILIDLNKIADRQERTYCSACLNDDLKIKPCHVKQIVQKIEALISQRVFVIQEEYDPTIQKIIKIMKSLTTLKEHIEKILDGLIQSAEDVLKELLKNMETEQDYYRNLLQGMNRVKLEEIAQILSGNREREQKNKDIKKRLLLLGKKVRSDFQIILKHQQDTLQQHQSIMLGKIIQRNHLQYSDICYSLASSSEKQIIVGGVGKNIIIWKQDQEELIEQAILKGHQDYVLSVLITGNLIISGSLDKSMKLWAKVEEQWGCVQTFQEINSNLKLTPDGSYLVSAGDKEIKIWQMMKNEIVQKSLQIIQQPTYYIAFSIDSKMMSCSSYNQLVKVYQLQANQIWMLHCQFETKGNIHRIHFTNNDHILCQQVNPPKILVYIQFQLAKEIILNTSDDNSILFPIFSIFDTIYLRNQSFLYVIMEKKNEYQARKIISGKFQSGCPDVNGNAIILSNLTKKRIELYKSY